MIDGIISEVAAAIADHLWSLELFKDKNEKKEQEA
jgi:hypothetical protein